ncbi:MAG: tail fiber protein [Verrucomicrobia bacterium]|nr:tail fiber protein [Verrucomicrobiota bacterium]
MPDQNQQLSKESIELEVRRSVASEVEAFRMSVEAHNAFLERSTKWFAGSVGVLAAAAGTAFAFFFGHSVKEIPSLVRDRVDGLTMVSEARTQMSNSLAEATVQLVSKSKQQVEASVSETVRLLLEQDVRGKIEVALADGIAQLKNLPTNQLESLVRSVPVRTILPFAGGYPVVTGWLPCDGREVPRSEFLNLFSVIGTSWGAGDGTNTFNVPDLRGRFVRGVDETAGRDPDKETRVPSKPGGNSGNRIGSAQDDALGSHRHQIVWGGRTEGQTYLLFRGEGDDGTDFPNNFKHYTAENAGANETRPKNVYVHFIIRY